ncbi:hypothetical protein GHT09_005531 [Marmota monax]|uniref:Uncharacterized protein n=1 Tax=Marmota monax TaxID=9995 RepID=A0A834PSA6_MARMO|nr:hypothetical protein GHT09_005531 [Marmota monax]
MSVTPIYSVNKQSETCFPTNLTVKDLSTHIVILDLNILLICWECGHDAQVSQLFRNHRDRIRSRGSSVVSVALL